MSEVISNIPKASESNKKVINEIFIKVEPLDTYTTEDEVLMFQNACGPTADVNEIKRELDDIVNDEHIIRPTVLQSMNQVITKIENVTVKIEYEDPTSPNQEMLKTQLSPLNTSMDYLPEFQTGATSSSSLESVIAQKLKPRRGRFTKKAFKCNICKARFQDSSNLKRHAYAHQRAAEVLQNVRCEIFHPSRLF